MTYEKFLKEQCRLALTLNKEEKAVKLLLMKNSGFTATQLYLNYPKEIPDLVRSKTLSDLELYFYKNQPVQYIIGYTYFYGLKLMIRRGVLIPRSETELVVEKVLENIIDFPNPKILDLGIGSGAIALALKKNRTDALLTGSDLSDTALEVASLNAKFNNLDITILKSNIFENINDRFDVLVSNPPYIDKEEDIDIIVGENEPPEALFAEKEGLYFYEEILRNANKVLKRSNLIVFEIPENKDRELISLVKTYYSPCEFEIVKDLNNLSRILIIKNYWRKYL
jgi:release factor glutamine methyltransferase